LVRGWRFLVAFSALAAAPFIVEAQRPEQPPKVGYLTFSSSAEGKYLEAFRAGLRDLGHIEGRTILLEIRWADNKPKRLTTLAADLIHQAKVAVIVMPSCGTLHISAVRDISSTIPLVIPICGDLPGFMGEVASFAKPGGATTGFTIFAPELSGKRIALLKEIKPNLSTVYVVWNPDSAGWEPYWHELHAAAQTLGVKLESIEARSPGDFDSAFRRIRSADDAAMITLTDPILWSERRRVIEFAVLRRLPAAYDYREFADRGGLIAYGPDIFDLLRRASIPVDKILKGVKPGDIPVERPTRLELVVNARAARALGVTIPQSMLLRADHVIQ
jgi:putative ABC transport system substrate-binding protein